MAHFLALVLVAADAPDPDGAARALMSPFHYDATVSPYKRYADPSEIHWIAARHSLPADDREGLVARYLEEGQEVGIDEFGFYFMETETPNPRWDWYARIGETYTTAAEALSAGVCTFAIVTPDGDWYERPQDEETYEWGDKAAWDAEFEAIVSRYPTAIPIVLDCHS